MIGYWMNKYIEFEIRSNNLLANYILSTLEAKLINVRYTYRR